MEKKGLFYLLKLTKPSYLLISTAIIIALIGAVAGLIVPLLTRDIIDGTLTNFSWQQVVFIALFFILNAATQGLTYYMLSYIGNKVVMKLRELLWDKIIYLPIPYFSDKMSGEILSRVIKTILLSP